MGSRDRVGTGAEGADEGRRLGTMYDTGDRGEGVGNGRGAKRLGLSVTNGGLDMDGSVVEQMGGVRARLGDVVSARLGVRLDELGF